MAEYAAKGQTLDDGTYLFTCGTCGGKASAAVEQAKGMERLKALCKLAGIGESERERDV